MSEQEKKTLSDHIAFAVMLLSSAVFLFGLGYAACYYGLVPGSVVESAAEGFEEVKKEVRNEKPWWVKEVDEHWDKPVRSAAGAYPGLNLVSRISSEKSLLVEVIDMDGVQLQEWKIDWHKLWRDATHLPDEVVPRSKPGTHVDGAAVMDNGDLVFNFEHLGMMRLDPRGRPVWKLAYQTHHSIELNGGYIWACGQRRHYQKDPDYPEREPPFDEYTLLKISGDGKIVSEWSVADLLRDNGYIGMMGFKHDPAAADKPLHRDDRLHLNDVEPFPEGMEEGFFRRGDVLVSLRNVNTVFVFSEDTGKIKYISTGRFTLQHDPDFIDGHSFSVFDNKYPVRGAFVSRVVVVDTGTGEYRTVFQGGGDLPFYTEFMGEHQWLPNGNLLLTESLSGRAVEVDRDGRPVWEYRNYIDPGVVGLVQEVRRLPLTFRDLWD